MNDEQVQPDEQEWLTADQAAEIFGVTKHTVHNWIARKRVDSKIVDRLRYISKSSIEASLEKQQEDRKARDLAFGLMNKKQATVETPIVNQGEVARLTKLLQDYTAENNRLKGKVEANERELDWFRNLFRELVKPQR